MTIHIYIIYQKLENIMFMIKSLLLTKNAFIE